MATCDVLVNGVVFSFWIAFVCGSLAAAELLSLTAAPDEAADAEVGVSQDAPYTLRDPGVMVGLHSL